MWIVDSNCDEMRWLGSLSGRAATEWATETQRASKRQRRRHHAAREHCGMRHKQQRRKKKRILKIVGIHFCLLSVYCIKRWCRYNDCEAGKETSRKKTRNFILWQYVILLDAEIMKMTTFAHSTFLNDLWILLNKFGLVNKLDGAFFLSGRRLIMLVFWNVSPANLIALILKYYFFKDHGKINDIPCHAIAKTL